MLRLFLMMAMFLGSLPVFAGENCTCRYKEADVNEGQTICMRTPSGSQMATCSRVLNNTSWKFLGTPCPLAQNKERPNQSRFDIEEAKNLLTGIQSSG